MKIRYMSDLHLEFEVYNNGERYLQDKYPYFSPIVTTDESDTILVLAGDVALADSPYTYVQFMEDMCGRFKDVIYVPGNHEYYRCSLLRAVDKMKENLQHTKVHVLDNEKVVIDGVVFLGSTLWTDFVGQNPLEMYFAQSTMADYRLIRTGTKNTPYVRKVTPADIVVTHLNAAAFLQEQLSYHKYVDEKPVVVVTHHLPSFLSVNEMYHSEKNGAYYSELGNMIVDLSPKLWIHGHTHHSCDYVIGETNIVCNPRGYRPNDLNPLFDDTKILTLK